MSTWALLHGRELGQRVEPGNAIGPRELIPSMPRSQFPRTPLNTALLPERQVALLVSFVAPFSLPVSFSFLDSVCTESL